MKKILAFGLIALLAIVVQSVVLINPVPLDDDVGIHYVLPSGMDRVTIIEDAASLSSPAPVLRVLSLVDVEKSTDNYFIYSRSTAAPAPVESTLIHSATANLRLQPQGIQTYNRIEEGLRQSRAEVYPRVGEMARHT